eukprot:CAMPEP_0194276048 /NCGR_PEP_ID=MMETSP0169-20130528/8733_1 /TAXON_ID=218684 /ORGANISM="Corethron pennatum, Strain L29A3" /LENGTH=54 /DNA_ID=CAMNT_0039019671 /DNA_START=140 /DNA_END=304 /DNA_ORIENTATION=-
MPLSFICLVLEENGGPEDGEGRKARKIVLVSGGLDALLQPFFDSPASDAPKVVE